MSVDIIFCVWGQYIYIFFGGCGGGGGGGGGWLRIKFSCEVHHRL